MTSILHPHLPTHVPAHRDLDGGWATCGFLFPTEEEAWELAVAVATETEARLEAGEDVEADLREFRYLVKLAVWGNPDHPLL